MKKFVLFIFLFFVFSIPAFAEYKPIPKELSKQYNREISKFINKDYYNVINEFNNYKPIPEILIDNNYIKTIPDNDVKQYQTDMNFSLQHILHDKITYNKRTLMQLLLDFDRESSNIYKKYLKNSTNKNQNKIYVQRLEKMRGTISLYPNAVVEGLKDVIDKYDLNIVPGAECDTLVYKYYIEKYDIVLAQELKTLLIIKQIVYSKINNYILEISDKI